MEGKQSFPENIFTNPTLGSRIGWPAVDVPWWFPFSHVFTGSKYMEVSITGGCIIHINQKKHKINQPASGEHHIYGTPMKPHETIMSPKQSLEPVWLRALPGSPWHSVALRGTGPPDPVQKPALQRCLQRRVGRRRAARGVLRWAPFRFNAYGLHIYIYIYTYTHTTHLHIFRVHACMHACMHVCMCIQIQI